MTKTTEKKYSRTIKGQSGRRYRYNYERSVLEWFDPETKEEISCIGLSREGFESDKKGWVDEYDSELDEELDCLVADFRRFG